MSDPVVTGCGIPVFGVKTCQNQKTVYYNAEQSLSCPAGFAAHTYVAAAGKFHSLLSQADADSQATVYLTDLIVGRCLPLVPVVTSATIYVVPSGAVNYQILATNSPASYTAAPLPVGLTLDPVTGIISGNVPATVTSYSISLSATNGAGTGYGTLTINVAANKVQIVFAENTGNIPYLLFVSIDGGSYAAASAGPTYSAIAQLKYKLVLTPGSYSAPNNSRVLQTTVSLPNGAVNLISGSCSASGTINDNGGSGGNPPLTPYQIAVGVHIGGTYQGINPTGSGTGNCGNGAYSLAANLPPGNIDAFNDTLAFYNISTKSGSTTMIGTNVAETILNF